MHVPPSPRREPPCRIPEITYRPAERAGKVGRGRVHTQHPNRLGLAFGVDGEGNGRGRLDNGESQDNLEGILQLPIVSTSSTSGLSI